MKFPNRMSLLDSNFTSIYEFESIAVHSGKFNHTHEKKKKERKKQKMRDMFICTVVELMYSVITLFTNQKKIESFEFRRLLYKIIEKFKKSKRLISLKDFLFFVGRCSIFRLFKTRVFTKFFGRCIYRWNFCDSMIGASCITRVWNFRPDVVNNFCLIRWIKQSGTFSS